MTDGCGIGKLEMDSEAMYLSAVLASIENMVTITRDAQRIRRENCEQWQGFNDNRNTQMRIKESAWKAFLRGIWESTMQKKFAGKICRLRKEGIWIQ